MITVNMNDLEKLYADFGCKIINDYEETERMKVFNINDIDNEDMIERYGKVNWDIETLREDEVEVTLTAMESLLNGYGYSIVENIDDSTNEHEADDSNHQYLENRMAEMAFFRTIFSFLSLVVSGVVLWKVW
jgi:hypothetical protein